MKTPMTSGDRHSRVQSTAIQIWELLDTEGELRLDEIKSALAPKAPSGFVDEAIEWLLFHDCITRRTTPHGTWYRSLSL